MWELMKPLWCRSPNADSILPATQDIQRELNADLGDRNIAYSLMTTASRTNRENNVELLGWGPEGWVEVDAVWRKFLDYKVMCVEVSTA